MWTIRMKYENTSLVQYPSNLKLIVNHSVAIQVRYKPVIQITAGYSHLNNPLPKALEEIARQTLTAFCPEKYRPFFQQNTAAIFPVPPIEDEVLSVFSKYSWLDIEFHSPSKFKQENENGKKASVTITSAHISGYVGLGQAPLWADFPLLEEIGRYKSPFPIRNDYSSASFKVLKALLFNSSLNDLEADNLIRSNDDQFAQLAPFYIQVRDPIPSKMYEAATEAQKVDDFLRKHRKQIVPAVKLAAQAYMIKEQMIGLHQDYDKTVEKYLTICKEAEVSPSTLSNIDEPLTKKHDSLLSDADSILKPLYPVVPRDILKYATRQGTGHRNNLIKRRLNAAVVCNKEAHRQFREERKRHYSDDYAF